MGFNGLQTTEIGRPPYFEALIPRNGADQIVTDGEARDGVCVLDPEQFLVTADFNVVLGKDGTA